MFTHETHFHIDLRAPVRRELPQNLLTDCAATDQANIVANERLIAYAQTLVDKVKMDMSFTEGEVVMLIPDMPNVPPQHVPVMIAQANQDQMRDSTTTRTMGTCQIIPNATDATPSLENVISPRVSAQEYMYRFEQQMYVQQKIATSSASITILQQPKHGVLRLVTETDKFGTGRFDQSAQDYVYLADKGYLGNDSATILVDIGGIKVKVIYFFETIDVASVGEGLQESLCEKGAYWKISSTLDSKGNSTINSVEYQSLTTSAASATVVDTAALASTLGTTLLSNLAGESTGVTVNLADLPGAAVGQTVGTTITLSLGVTQSRSVSGSGLAFCLYPTRSKVRDEAIVNAYTAQDNRS